MKIAYVFMEVMTLEEVTVTCDARDKILLIFVLLLMSVLEYDHPFSRSRREFFYEMSFILFLSTMDSL